MLDVPTKPSQYTNSTRYPDWPQYPSAVFQRRTPRPQYYYYYNLSSNSATKIRGSISSAASSGQSSLQPKENEQQIQAIDLQSEQIRKRGFYFTLRSIVEFSDGIEEPLKLGRQRAGI